MSDVPTQETLVAHAELGGERAERHLWLDALALLGEVERLKKLAFSVDHKREQFEKDNERLRERVAAAEKERDRLYLENDKLNGETEDA